MRLSSPDWTIVTLSFTDYLILQFPNFSQFKMRQHVFLVDSENLTMSHQLRDQLHWLPIRQRIDFKIATLVYKSLNHLAPEYLLDMLHLASDDTGLCRNRSAANGQLIPVQWKTVNFGKRNFYYSAPCVWNNIPVEIRQQRTLTAFKSKLKTFLFQKAYLSN